MLPPAVIYSHFPVCAHGILQMVRARARTQSHPGVTYSRQAGEGKDP
jgi:hypothetical protein